MMTVLTKVPIDTVVIAPVETVLKLLLLAEPLVAPRALPALDGLYLRQNVSLYADSIPNMLVILWYKHSESRWVPHIPAMEAGVYDREFAMFVTLKINVSSDVVFGFAGV